MWIGRHEAKSTAGPKLDQCWIVHIFIIHIFLVLTFLQSGESTQIIRFEMEEEKPPGYLVGLLIKQLPDAILTGPGKLTFRTIQEGHAELFSLGPTDGRIQVAHRIDRENLCPDLNEQSNSPQSKSDCQLSFSVTLLRLTTVGTDIVDILRIIILLHDIDDNVCFFTPSNQQLIKLPENIPSNQLAHIPLHSPCDLDTGPGNGIEQSSIRLRMSATSTTPSSSAYPQSLHDNPIFALQMNKTGLVSKPFALFLIPQQTFDYEAVNRYDLVVEASGANRSADRICRLKLTVEILDQNDFPPKFTQNHSVIKIPETASLNVPIYTLSAVDSDLGPLYSQLIYEFDVHATPAVIARFRIDHQNGSIFLRAPLDYRKQALYDIPLIVRNPLPQENTESPTKLNEVLLNPKEARFIDRALLQVYVLDVNDQPPVISAFTPDGGDRISLREHSRDIPIDIAVVTVVDEDTGTGNLINCTLAEPFQKQFSLSLISPTGKSVSDSGMKRHQQPLEMIYKLSALVSFDRETTSDVNVKIYCEDAGSPPLQAEYTVHVHVDDVNDHAPVLNQTKLRLSVTEDSDPIRKHRGYVIGQISATDRDVGENARLTYQLVRQNKVLDYFTIDNETGLIRSRGNLDRERRSHHQLEVKIMDGGEPPHTASGTVNVHVLDYNDESPVFDKQSYEFHIVENNNLGELIGSLRATDNDEGPNAVIHFHLEPLTKMSDHYRRSFRVQSISSLVDTDGELPFDLVSYFDTVHNAYEIRIYASQVLDREAIRSTWNNNYADHTLVELDQNGKHASNNNDNMHKRFNSNNDKNSPSYKFWVVGEDAGTPKRRGQTLVNVFVDDVNDQAPVFLNPETNTSVVSMSYLEKVGHMIRHILATDRDAGLNGTVRYRLEQVRFHNYTRPHSKGNFTSLSSSKPPAHFSLTQLFTVHPVTGVLRLSQKLIPADVGSLFIVSVVAEDMGVPHTQRTSASFYIQIDDSVPIGDPMDDVGDYPSDSSSAYAYGASEDGSSLNFYIIISIVSASFMVSAILISGICIALRRRKQAPVQSVARSTDANGGTNLPMSNYYPAEKLKTGISTDELRNDSYCAYSMEPSNVSPKHANCMPNSTELKQPNNASDPNFTSALDPLLTYGPQLMQVVNLQSCSSTVSSVPDMKTLRLVCSEHGTLSPHLLGNSYETNEMKPSSTDATIILCAPEYDPNMYSSNIHSPVHVNSHKLSATVPQPVTLINYSHPMEVQHLCVHPPQVNAGKRNSLGSTDQDSGNGDSLNTPSAPVVTGTKQSIWLPTPLAISRTSPPVHSLTLPLVHVYTPLTCVKETETNGTNSVGLPH